MLPIDRLGLSAATRPAVERKLTHGAGLVLVTGPTGSGKTTTVYSLLNLLDDGRRNIVAIEDPVEYRVSFIRQTEVAPRHDLTMTTALRDLHVDNRSLAGHRAESLRAGRVPGR